MTPDVHYERAEELLQEGVVTVNAIRALNERRKTYDLTNADDLANWTDATNHMDELGKKATGIWAQAQVHATLANTRPEPRDWRRHGDAWDYPEER